MKIFLISGKAQAGKGEVAKVIKNYYNQKQEKSVITEFSKYIKLFATEMTSWTGETKQKPRKFLQDMGYYIRNYLNMPDFFINRMKEDIKIYEYFFDNIIIADVRYPSEILKIKESYENVYSIHITRTEQNTLKVEEANHESEHALKDFEYFDYKIENKEKEELIERIKNILEEIK